MGEAELKIALQREGEARIRGFWQAAETAIAEKRQEVEAQKRQLQAEHEQRLQAEVTKLRNERLFTARSRAMQGRLHAETELETRLFALAGKLLPELAEADRAASWRLLSDELPQAEWYKLEVHPADRDKARRDFPAAEVVTEETLCGGLIATNSDGTIRIDNSLHCRLKRAWPDLLPGLLDELRKRVNDDETAQADPTA